MGANVLIIKNHKATSETPGLSGRIRLSIALLLAIVAFCPAALADTYTLKPGQTVIGSIQWVRAKSSDTLSELARRFDLGYDAIVLANPKVDSWLPGQGTRIRLPMRHILPNAPHKGIVLNLAEKRLYYYPKTRHGKDAVVITHPVGVGVKHWNTPLGQTSVVRKIHNPTWYPPASIKKEHAKYGDILPDKVTPGPNDPLGHFALRLGIPGYLIHGTNKPAGIGMRVSHGCVRLYPVDIQSLFQKVPVGTPVHIVNQPYKAGWANGHLYLQAYPNTIREGRMGKDANDMTPLVKLLTTAASKHPGTKINWQKALSVAQTANGIPKAVATLPGHG